MNTETLPAPHIILVDFNRLQRGEHEALIELGRERDLADSHHLVDGAPALFVELGELEMQGILRRRIGAADSPYPGAA